MNKYAKNTLWYMIGFGVYFISLWLMTVLVPKLSGSFEEAGVLNTAMSICNIFVMMSNFSVRNYQVADINDKYSKGEYITFRFITCGISLLILPIYLVIMRYSAYIIFLVLCYMLLKICEALVDVVQGIFQKTWRLDIVCRSLTIRGIANLAVFAVMEYITKDLIAALLTTAVISLILVFFLDFYPCFKMYEIKINFKNRRLWELCLCCVPLFFHGILSTLIANIPRLFAQNILGEKMLGYYASVSAPTIIVQVAAGNIFSPVIPLLAEKIKVADRGAYKIIAGIFLVILAIGICAVLGFRWLGNWFLSTMFGKEIISYSNLLIPSVFVSVLTAAAWFVASLFTVIDKNITMVILEGGITLLMLICTPFVINEKSLQGINIALIGGYMIYIAVGMMYVLREMGKSLSERREEKYD